MIPFFKLKFKSYFIIFYVFFNKKYKKITALQFRKYIKLYCIISL